MLPVNGVTAESISNNISLHENYMKALLKAGSIPLVLPFAKGAVEINEILAHIDGLMLTGGTDVDPELFGEEPEPGLQKVDPKRDRFEKMLILEALQKDLPIFAICRGNQMLNVAAGGTLYQDIFSLPNVLQHHQNAPRNHQSHHIQIYPGTQLSKLVTGQRWKVNSFHHQSVKDPAPGFQISAVSADGVTEAIESQQHQFVIGVQWHPSDLVDKDPNAAQLFASFVQACSSKLTPRVP